MGLMGIPIPMAEGHGLWADGHSVASHPAIGKFFIFGTAFLPYTLPKKSYPDRARPQDLSDIPKDAVNWQDPLERTKNLLHNALK